MSDKVFNITIFNTQQVVITPNYNNTEECYDSYKNAIKKRSDSAEDYVYKVLERANITDMSIGDCVVNSFLKRNGLRQILTDEKNKTPDMMIYLSGINVLLVGDVAVTNNTPEVVKIKEEKYRKLRDDIQDMNVFEHLRVQPFDIIFNDKLENINEINNKIYDQFEVKPTKTEIDDFTYNIRTIQKYCSLIRTNVREKKRFDEMMIEGNRQTESFKTLKLYGEGKQIQKFKGTKSNTDIFNEIMGSIKKKKIGKKVSYNDVNFKKEIIGEIRTKQQLQGIRNIKTPLNFIMNMEDEEEKQDLDLLEDYVDDLTYNADTTNHILDYLPMKKWFKESRDIISDKKENILNRITDNDKGYLSTDAMKKKLKKEYNRSSQYYCSKKELSFRDIKNTKFEEEIKKIKKRNKPKDVRTIHVDYIERCKENIEVISDYMSGQNDKFKSINYDLDKYDTPKQKNRDMKNIEEHKEIFDFINESKGMIYNNNTRKFVNDCTHIPAGLKDGVYYSIPQLKNGITLILTVNNLGSQNPTIIYKTITRYRKETYESKKMVLSEIYLGFIDEVVKTDRFVYVLSKTRSDSMEVLGKLKNVDNQVRLHALANSIYLSTKQAKEYLKKYIGLSTIIANDTHQRPSSLLDLMKYIVGMTMSAENNVKELLSDKLFGIYKTTLDLFLIDRITEYYQKNLDSLKRYCLSISTKTQLSLHDEFIEKKFKAYSFFNLDFYVKLKSVYLQECQLLFQLRPKKLYKSQFIDKAQLSCLQFNRNMEDEISESIRNEEPRKDKFIECNYDVKEYNYNWKHMIDKSAVCNMIEMQNRKEQDNLMKIYGKTKAKLEDFAINNCSMRGSCMTYKQITELYKDEIEEHIRERKIKMMDTIVEEEDMDENETEEMLEEKERLNTGNQSEAKMMKKKKIGFSATSLYNTIKLIQKQIEENDSENARILNLVRNGMGRQQYYNMSEKEQRGDGRPIAAADALTKQKLYVVETPFEIAGNFMDDNLLGQGKNRSATLASAVNDVKNRGVVEGKNVMGYFIQDQSKFSEGDNLDKFIMYVANSDIVSDGLKQICIGVLVEMKSRLQHFPRNSKKAIVEYRKYIDETTLFIKCIAGWPQGMLNRISTCFHVGVCDYLCTIYNENVKEEDQVVFRNLVNSDDSCTIVSAGNMKTIKQLYHFIERGKKMFCLRQNEKKSYLSYAICEIIQKYVINESVINIWAKDLTSITENIIGIDFSRDITSCIGSMLNCYSNGAPETIMTYARYEVKKKIFREYNMGKGMQNDVSNDGIDITKLPCEMGGWPGLPSTFELCVAGYQSQNMAIINRIYEKLYEKKTENLDEIELDNEEKMIISSCSISMMSKMREKAPRILKDDEILEDREEQGRIEDNIRVRDQMEIIRSTEKEEKFKRIDLLENGIEINELIEEMMNDDDIKRQNYIEVVDSMDRSGDNSLIRKLMSCYKIIFPISKKITKTIEELRKIKYESNPMGILVRNRVNIQTAVADRRDMAQEDVIQMSETNLISSPKKRASTTSFVASSNCIRIPFVKKLLTIKDYFKTILKSFDVIKTTAIYKSVIGNLKRILFDNTNRSNIAYDIVMNTIEKGRVGKGKIIVNKKPMIYDEMRIKNPIAIVLLYIADKQYIKENNIVIKYKAMIESDAIIIRNKYRVWFENINTKMVVQSIFFNYLGIRRTKWQLSPFLRPGNDYDFYFDLSLRNRYINEESVGQLLNTSVSKYMSDDETPLHIMKSNVIAGIELSNFMKNEDIGVNFSKDKIFISDNGKMERLGDIIGDDAKKFSLFSVCDDHEKRMMCGYEIELSKTVGSERTKDDLIRDYFKQEGYIIHWVKEQSVSIQQGTSTKVWMGEFIAIVSKGRFSIQIEGVPGNIRKVESNVADPFVISDLFGYFFSKIEFKGDGYRLVKNKNEWQYADVCKTRNKTSTYLVINNIIPSLTLRRERERRGLKSVDRRKLETAEKKRFISEQKRKEEMEKLLWNVMFQTGVQDSEDLESYIPVEINMGLARYSRKETSNLIKVDFDDKKYEILEEYEIKNRFGESRRIKKKIISVPRTSMTSSYTGLMTTIEIDGIEIQKLIEKNIISDVIRNRDRPINKDVLIEIMGNTFDIMDYIQDSFTSLIMSVVGVNPSEEKPQKEQIVDIFVDREKAITEFIKLEYDEDEIFEISEYIMDNTTNEFELGLETKFKNRNLRNMIMKGIGDNLISANVVDIGSAFMMSSVSMKVLKVLNRKRNYLNEIEAAGDMDEEQKNDILIGDSNNIMLLCVRRCIINKMNEINEFFSDYMNYNSRIVPLDKFGLFVSCIKFIGNFGQMIKRNIILKNIIEEIKYNLDDFVSRNTFGEVVSTVRKVIKRVSEDNNLSIGELNVMTLSINTINNRYKVPKDVIGLIMEGVPDRFRREKRRRTSSGSINGKLNTKREEEVESERRESIADSSISDSSNLDTESIVTESSENSDSFSLNEEETMELLDELDI